MSSPPPLQPPATAPSPSAGAPAKDARPASASPPAGQTTDAPGHTQSRKRDREGSLEPSALANSDPVLSKKNRRLDSDSSTASTPSPVPSPAKAGATTGEDEHLAPGVGQIRKKVRDLDWEEKEDKKPENASDQDQPKDQQKDDKNEAQGTETSEQPTTDAKDEQKKGQENTPLSEESTKNCEVSRGTQAESKKLDGKEQGAKSSDSPAPSAAATTTTTTEAAAPSAPKATQPTFASFTSSSDSSPFVTGASGSRSWLASSSPAVSGAGLRGSPLGSSLGRLGSASRSGTPDATTSSSPASSSTPGGKSPRPQAPTNAAKGKAAMPSSDSLGFGSFAAGPGFAFASKSSSPFSAAAATLAKKDSAKAEDTTAKGKDSFVTALEESNAAGAQEKAEEEALQEKQKPKLEAKVENYWTGEEDETNVFSHRAKLFTGGETGSWRERGTGTIRLNISKDSKSGQHRGGRLVMRADGVLRVILNVKLFAGMKCEVQDKFVKLVALENGQLVHFAIRFPNVVPAAGFQEAVEANAPEKA